MDKATTADDINKAFANGKQAIDATHQPVAPATSKPVINSGNNVTIKAGDHFDPTTGVTASDTQDGDLTNQLQTTITNANGQLVSVQDAVKTPGQYSITYKVTNKAGQSTAVSKSFTVDAVQEPVAPTTSKPVINSGNNVTIKAGDHFDPTTGVTASDTQDGDLTNQLQTTITNANGQLVSVQDAVKTPGQYSITYKVTNKAGQSTAVSKSFTVDAVQEPVAPTTSKPVINSGNNVTIKAGDHFDPTTGVTASDTQDGDLTNQLQTTITNANGQLVSVQDAVKTPGQYSITYKVTNKAGQSTAVSKSFTVDAVQEPVAPTTSKPVINSGNNVTIKAGDHFDPTTGVTASDTQDGDLTNQLQTTITNANGQLVSVQDAVKTPGQYSITYKVTNKAGQSTAVSKSFTVDAVQEPVAPTTSKPVINSGNNVTIKAGDHFDPTTGVTASDTQDGDLTNQLQTTITNANGQLVSVQDAVKTPGQYSITYKVTNKAGQSTAVSKSFTVDAVQEPVAPTTSKPVINSGNNVTIKAGDHFDPTTGVTASDTQDGDLTNQLQTTITNANGQLVSVQDAVKTPGQYSITYKVTNKAGQSTAVSKSFTVDAVQEPVAPTASKPVINSGNNVTIKAGDHFDPTTGVTASDTQDGDLTNQLQTTITNANGQLVSVQDAVKTPGQYSITYKVTNKAGQSTAVSKSFTVDAVQEPVAPTTSKPVINSGNNVTIKAGDHFDPTTGVTASDTQDGDLTNQLQTTITNANGQLVSVQDAVKTPGQYSITYKVTNKAGQSTAVSKSFTVDAVQEPVAPTASKPVINSGNNVTIKAGDHFDPTTGVTTSDTQRKHDNVLLPKTFIDERRDTILISLLASLGGFMMTFSKINPFSKNKK
ncbi:immunoglobulin-like domain-containing protein (plasmid) [Leuconostoc suionicum]|uniref:immunoglobulin-like domain-containing protein n=1 Tax=Leuconostoc suionicum TaxID=1511761 RepID=UPI00374A5E69